MLEDFFFLCGVLYVLEPDLPLSLNGGADRVCCIVSRLVVLLRSTFYMGG